MKLQSLLPVSAFLLASIANSPAFADTEAATINAGGVMLTTAGSVATIANGTLWLGHNGSVVMGTVGALLGVAQIAFGIAADPDDNGWLKPFSMTAGALGVVAGVASVRNGRTNQQAGRHVGVEPVVDFASREAGLQLVARW